MKKSHKNILSWLAVLPGSLVAGFLILFPLHWILYWLLSSSGEPDAFSIRFFTQLLGDKYTLYSVETFLSPIVTMITVILTSYVIAPKYKLNTSIIIASAWVIFIVSGILLLPDRLSIDLRTVCTFIAIVSAVYINWNKSKSERLIATENP